MRAPADSIRLRVMARLAVAGVMVATVAGCADTRFGSEPLYSPFGPRGGDTTAAVAPPPPSASVYAAPTTRVSSQQLPPPSYPGVTMAPSGPDGPSYDGPGRAYPPSSALPPPPNRWGQHQATYAALPPQGSYAPPQPTYAPPRPPATVAAAPAPAYRPMVTAALPPRVETTGAAPVSHGSSDSWTWDGGTAVSVKPGETVDILARRYGVPTAAIMRANNLADPKLIHPGQRLVIPTYTYRPGAAPQGADRTRTASIPPQAPASAAPARPGASRLHTVNSGETLTGIARRYRVTRAALASANGLSVDSRLSLGQRLVIPGLAPQAAPTASSAPSPAAPPPSATTQRRADATPPEPAAEPAAAPPPPPPLASAKPMESASMAQPTATPEEAKSEQRQGLSFRWPVHGRVIAEFGSKPGGERNDGINISVPQGASIRAAEDGVVAYAGAELKGYGNLVLIRHADDWVTAYAHNSEMLVKRGDRVKRGQVISKAGQSGSVNTPQLHFEVRRGSNPVDPKPLLPSPNG